MSNREDSKEVAAVVNVSGQGTQVGTGGTQTNNYYHPRQPLDLASLTDIEPHIAVARLQRLTHDECVNYFAKASPGEVSELLGVFFEVDKAKVIATLGDINRRKAADLIENLSPRGFLAPLPEAAYKIARMAVSLRWTDVGPLKRVGEGYARRYENGRVFWDDRAGVHVTVGVIDDYATANGAKWGVPIGDEETVHKSPYGTQGTRQEFQVGTVYSSVKGVYHVVEEVCYAHEGSTHGWLGFPIGEIEANPRIGNVQRFEGGLIYSGTGEERVAFSVQQDVFDTLPGTWEIRPLSKEVNTVSSAGTAGFIQDFECMDWELFRVVSYGSEAHGVVPVTGEILTYYSEIGAERSRLGFPTSPVVRISENISVQSFQAGMIYMKPGSLFAVSDKFANVIPDGCAPYEVLGFPASEELSISASELDTIQFFENGVIRINDEQGEMWVRPQSELAPIIYVDHRASELELGTGIPSEPEDDGFVDD